MHKIKITYRLLDHVNHDFDQYCRASNLTYTGFNAMQALYDQWLLEELGAVMERGTTFNGPSYFTFQDPRLATVFQLRYA